MFSSKINCVIQCNMIFIGVNRSRSYGYPPGGAYSFQNLLRGLIGGGGLIERRDLIERGAYLFIQKTSDGDHLFELQ